MKNETAEKRQQCIFVVQFVGVFLQKPKTFATFADDSFIDALYIIRYMKRTLLLVSLLVSSLAALQAETIEVKNYTLDGPYAKMTPFMVDSTDVNGKVFTAPDTLCRASFVLETKAFANVRFEVKGVRSQSITVDDVRVNGHQVALRPNLHAVTVDFSGQPDKLSINVSTDAEGVASVADPDASRHYYSIEDVLHSRRPSDVSLSPSGRYMLVSVSQTLRGGRQTRETRLVAFDAKGRVASSRAVAGNPRWMPHTDELYTFRDGLDGREFVITDVASGAERVVADHLPDGQLRLAPTGDWMLLTVSASAPGENPGVYEVLEPADRQAGWRSRSNVQRYDLATGQTQTITYGHHNVYVSDISADGRYLLLQKSESRLSQRPTSVSTLWLFDLQTFEAETLVEKDGFFSSARFSPDGKRVLLSGSPEALGGIGLNVPEGRIPNIEDNQLFLMTLADHSILPLTRDFNPSVSQFTWNKADGRIWFTAEDRDSVNLFVLDIDKVLNKGVAPERAITELSMPEEMITRINFAADAPVAVWVGNSVSNSDRLYTLDLRKFNSTLIEDYSATNLADVELGKAEDWTFANSRGETIYARYYLPPFFDASKRYPMIVNYYGGCSPTSRTFEGRYPQHAYAALGYVVLIINPSGATGFGQEFSSRHVNTAGQGVAEDIIEGTKQFCSEHSWVDADHIGCIGASYGGFMTQYLLTQTDIFAAGVSHAGISDHTGYWGEGYWGYSYSEVSMANRYPWTDQDLYAGQSPLYNADKIHTPLLFVHGDSDTNVPPSESIGMFTALKLLDRPTALVMVKGENHWIMDYDKRLRWQDTIWAWFARWLQSDDTWWKNMYPDKNL